MPAFERVDGAVVELGGCADGAEVTRCVCQELAEARDILAGDRGGLSEDESVIIAQYVRILRDTPCGQCEFDVSRVAKAGELSCYVYAEDGGGWRSSGSSTLLGGSDTSSEAGAVRDFVDASSGESESGSDSEVDALSERVVGGGQYQVPPARGFAREALEEYVEIMERQMESADSKARHWARVLLRAGVEGSVLDKASDTRLAHYVLRVESGFVSGVIGTGADPQSFQRVYDYDQDCFYDVERLPGGQGMLPRECSSSVYTNTSYQVWNQPMLIAFAKRILGDDGLGPVDRMRFVNGVFGCGKTTEIISEYSKGTLYLSATRASVLKVRKQLYGNSKNGRRFVMTYDAAAIHGVPPGVVRVRADEVPMIHPGLLLALLEVIKPKDFVAYGDFFQIPYIPFLACYKMRCGSLRDFCDMEMRSIQHRCRVSICAAVLDIYGRDSGLGVCRCCEHMSETEEAFQVRDIASLAQVPMERGVKYITFTQKEKEEVASALVVAGVGSVVSTLDELVEETRCASSVHESQGGTYARVALVRCVKNTKPGSIYFSPEHVLVALTRAKLELVYYTASLEFDYVRECYVRSCDESLRAIVRKNSGLE